MEASLLLFNVSHSSTISQENILKIQYQLLYDPILSISTLRPRRHCDVHTERVPRCAQKLWLNHKFKALSLWYLYSPQQALLEACAVVPPCFLCCHKHVAHHQKAHSSLRSYLIFIDEKRLLL